MTLLFWNNSRTYLLQSPPSLIGQRIPAFAPASPQTEQAVPGPTLPLTLTRLGPGAAAFAAAFAASHRAGGPLPLTPPPLLTRADHNRCMAAVMYLKAALRYLYQQLQQRDNKRFVSILNLSSPLVTEPRAHVSRTCFCAPHLRARACQ
jgi:hypothetical protein